ncbi:hypothetical protein [Streptomyces sp. NPDC049040]|uniref:hypothetical protein n=1 Tax=Streptomyces sp. NPDC049040 TaxID=3365593 RepID=UPI0037106981
MSAAQRGTRGGPQGKATLLAHALGLRGRHGKGPWPAYGDPLPDGGGHRLGFAGGGEDALLRRDAGEGGARVTAADVAGHLEQLPAAPESGAGRLHDLLAGCSAIDIADGLGAEVLRRGLPPDGLRRVGRELAQDGTHREAVKIGLVLLGLGGDVRDRELLLLLGTLEELTLYAAVALRRSQPDPEPAVHELARRVAGWGRIQAVRVLGGTVDPVDPAVRAWLLREGFRNTISDEYLAHIAATAGDLRGALGPQHVDTALLDGAGGILAALARSQGGPAPGLADYRDAVPVLHRYADLAPRERPATVAALRDLIGITAFFRHPPDDLAWADAAKAELAARYERLLLAPHWPAVVLDHLADPRRPDFALALHPAAVLGLRPQARILARLETGPSLLDPTWAHALRTADPRLAARVAALAERRAAVAPQAERDQARQVFAHLAPGLADRWDRYGEQRP